MKANPTISYVNIGLMVLSAALALLFPFELFLFSIIILGPLHYLTEVSWLEKRSFFSQSKGNALFLVLLCILLIIPAINKKTPLYDYQIPIMLGAFVYAIGLIRNTSFWVNLAYFGVAFSVAVLFSFKDMYWVLITFGVLLPTIIHVLIFTGLFLLSGALKNKTWQEYTAVAVFVACVLAIMLPQYSFDHYTISSLAKNLYVLPLASLNVTLIKIFSTTQIHSVNDIFIGAVAIKIMSLIAFAYTYHYFNWFSKTTVIKWHQVSKIRLTGIVLIWVFVVGLCAYDYKTGFLVLSFMSLLHVALEFPLNIKSMGDIKRAIVG
jgi:hypothetical protein